jgi:hypothetical protein
MHPGVPQIMLGLLLIVGGILIVKLLGNDYGWIAFLAGAALGSRGAMQISQSGQKEIGN